MMLITGAQGMVGSYIESVFTDDARYAASHTSMDVTNIDAVRRTFDAVQPTIVVHLAAATDVDRCQTDAEWAYRTNVEGTRNMAQAAQQANAVFVYVSTGGVFDGTQKDAHTEKDVPRPVNVYATTKLAGEEIAQDLVRRCFIVRAGWMMGGMKKDKKFVSKIVQLCQEKNEIYAVNDKLGTITYAKDFLVVLKQLIQTSAYGLYHVANEGVCSRYDIAVEIVKLLKSAATVHACASDRFPLPAPRPRSEALFGHTLQTIGVKPLRPWREALQEYLQELT